MRIISIFLLIFLMFSQSVANADDCQPYTSEDGQTAGIACRDNSGRWIIKKSQPIENKNNHDLQAQNSNGNTKSVTDVISGHLVHSYISDNRYATYYSPDGKMIWLQDDGYNLILREGNWWKLSEKDFCVQIKNVTCMTLSVLDTGKVAFRTPEWTEVTTSIEYVGEGQYQKIRSRMLTLQNENKNRQIGETFANICATDFFACLLAGYMVGNTTETVVTPLSRRRDDCYEECQHLLPSPSGDLQSMEYQKCYTDCRNGL
jgi:hypothetical protein